MSSIFAECTLSSNDLESIATSAENVELLKTLQAFSEILSSCGIQVPVSSPGSLMALSELTTAKKREIQNGFQLHIDFCSPIIKASSTTPFHVSHEAELECLRNALDYHNFDASDEFWKTFNNDQVVEVYGHDMKQIYRGLNFYKYTGYSLLDVSVFEWYVLWERPKMIIQMMMDQTKAVMDSNLNCFKFQIPRHVNRETKNTGLNADFVPRACAVEFQHCGVIKSPQSLLQKGFICTSQGEMIAEGREALSINFV